MSIEEQIAALVGPPEAANEVVTLDRGTVETILGELEAANPLRGLVVELRSKLAEPREELWITHSPGPGEVWAFLSKEAAEEDARKTIELCDQIAERENWGDEWVSPKINVLPSPWTPAEHYRYCAEDAIERLDDLGKRYEALKDHNSKLLAAAQAVIAAPDSTAALLDLKAAMKS